MAEVRQHKVWSFHPYGEVEGDGGRIVVKQPESPASHAPRLDLVVGNSGLTRQCVSLKEHDARALARFINEWIEDVEAAGG